MKPRKSDIVRDRVQTGNYKLALHIARDFRLGFTDDERVQMSRAYECMVHPEFFVAIGKDPEAEIRAGIEILNRHYGKECVA